MHGKRTRALGTSHSVVSCCAAGPQVTDVDRGLRALLLSRQRGRSVQSRLEKYVTLCLLPH